MFFLCLWVLCPQVQELRGQVRRNEDAHNELEAVKDQLSELVRVWLSVSSSCASCIFVISVSRVLSEIL